MTTKEDLKKTPIGKLLEMGMSDKIVADITGVSASAVSKWRTGENGIHGVRQVAAKAYLDGLTAKPAPKPEPADADTRLFMAEVPQSKVGKFNAVLNMLGINAVDME